MVYSVPAKDAPPRGASRDDQSLDAAARADAVSGEKSVEDSLGDIRGGSMAKGDVMSIGDGSAWW